MYIAHNPQHIQRKTFLSFAVQKDRIAALLPGPRLCSISMASPLRRKHATVFSLFSSDSRPIPEIVFLLKKFGKMVKISEISHLSMQLSWIEHTPPKRQIVRFLRAVKIA